jgi:Tfp pilus assembly protein PilN
MNGSLNLARRPYVNSRPVVRTAWLLWIVGALLLFGNVYLFWSYLAGSSEKRAERARLEDGVVEQQKKVGELEARLAQLDLEQQNEQVAFLNSKIGERTFSWSLLFERLAEVLPNGVRLIQLQPAAIAGDDRPGSRPAPPTTTLRGRRPMGTSDRVPLIIQAESKSDEALSDFVDRLFAHPSFEDPDVSRETRDEDHENRLRFDLRVTYIPAGTAGAKAETGK